MPKTILVTGINGFIGSHLALELLEKGYQVIGVDQAYPKNIPKKIRFFRLDLTKDNTYRELPRDIDTIIHLAALMDKNPDEKKLIKVFTINCLATLKLLEFARKIKIKKFIFSSTANAIGFRDRAIKENSRAIPEDFYGFTKRIGEDLVKYYCYHFKTQILRIFFPYGPGQTDNALLTRLIKNIKNRKEIIIYNLGRNPVLSVIYIDDLISLMLKLINSDTGIINITSEEKFSILEICDMLGKRIGIKPRYKYINDNKKKNMYAALTNLKKNTDYKYKVNFNQGLDIVMRNLNE